VNRRWYQEHLDECDYRYHRYKEQPATLRHRFLLRRKYTPAPCFLLVFTPAPSTAVVVW
jgi:hypothetical protein